MFGELSCEARKIGHICNARPYYFFLLLPCLHIHCVSFFTRVTCGEPRVSTVPSPVRQEQSLRTECSVIRALYPILRIVRSDFVMRTNNFLREFSGFSVVRNSRSRRIKYEKFHGRSFGIDNFSGVDQNLGTSFSIRPHHNLWIVWAA